MIYRFTPTLFCGALLLIQTVLLYPQVTMAQQGVIPVPDPVVGPVPSAREDAQETHDEVAIRHVMKVVELSRMVAGGISQLFGAAQGQKQVLDQLYGAHTGTREMPELKDAGKEGRDGGNGLTELADGALNGAVEGPQDLMDALNEFRTTFALDKAFQLKTDELPSKRMLAQLAAKGAISASTAENAYKRANASMDRLDGYVTALQASQDLKASIDINTRAMIELTQQTNESLRTQAAITSIVSTYFMIMASEASEEDWVDGLKNFNR